LLAAGLAVIAAAWLGPLPGLAVERFAALAALDVALVCAAAPLFAAAAAGSRFDPVVRWPQGFSPLATSLLQWGIAWSWHTQAAQLVMRVPAGFWLQQATILLASVLLWLSVLGGEREARYERAGTGIVALLLTSVHMTMLGGLARIAEPPFGSIELAASVDDRRLGALLMIVGAASIYVVAGSMLLTRLLRPQLERNPARRKVSPRQPAEAEAQRQRDGRQSAALRGEAAAEIAEEIPAQTRVHHGARLELPVVQRQLAVGARAGRGE